MKLLLTLNILFFSFYLIAQREYKWGELPQRSEYDTENDLGVIILKSVYNYDFGLGNYSLSASYFHCKVLGDHYDEGLKFYFKYHEYDELETISLRVHKRNGDVLIFHSDEVPLKRMKDLNSDHIYNAVVVNQVEKGDEFELVFEVKENRMLYGQDFWSYKSYPSLKNEFKLTNHSRFPLSIQSNMDYSKIKVEEKGNLSEVTWQTENTPGLMQNPWIDFERSVPYVGYLIFSFDGVDPSVDYSGDRKSEIIWTHWYTYFKDKFTSNVPRQWVKYEKRYNYRKSHSEGTSLRKVLEKLVQNVNSNFAVRRSSFNGNNYQDQGFSRNENLTYDEIVSLYFKVLKKTGAPFKLGMASSINDGFINKSGANSYRISGFYFSIENEGETIYLFPSQPFRAYGLDEIPLQFQGTLGIEFDPSASLKKYTVPSFQILPQSKSKENKIMIKNMHQISSSGDILTDSKLTTFGDINQLDSILFLSRMKEVFEKKYEYENSVSEGNRKRVLKCKTINKNITVSDSSFLIPLSQLLMGDFISLRNQDIDVMLPLKFQKRQQDYFVFEEDVELLLPEVWNTNHTLEFYSMSFKIHQLNSKTIMFQIDEKYTRKYMSISDMDMILKMKKELKSNLNEALVVKRNNQ